jgi:hypothetical protein
MSASTEMICKCTNCHRDSIISYNNLTKNESSLPLWNPIEWSIIGYDTQIWYTFLCSQCNEISNIDKRKKSQKSSMTRKNYGRGLKNLNNSIYFHTMKILCYIFQHTRSHSSTKTPDSSIFMKLSSPNSSIFLSKITPRSSYLSNSSIFQHDNREDDREIWDKLRE